jgi:glutathione peroxidase-family protein
LKVFGVPCNQFGLQEPGQGIEIVKSLQYVRPGNGFKPNFDLLVKRDVNGEKEDALFTWLKVCCCQADIRMCSHCLFPVVVTSLEQVVIILLQGWWR